MVGFTISSNAAGSDSFAPLRHKYGSTIHPLLKQLCFECHSKKKQEADLNLESFSSLAEVRQHPRTWQKVLFMLDNDEMPPQDNEPLLFEGLQFVARSVRRWLDQVAV